MRLASRPTSLRNTTRKSIGVPSQAPQVSADPIIPRAVCPELDNVIANLELMPRRMNESKNDRVGARQVDLARKFNTAGLLSDKGLKAVESAAR